MDEGMEIDDHQQNMTALHLAAKYGHEESARLLLRAGGIELACKRSLTGMTPLHLAAENGHAALIRMLITTGVDPDCVSEARETAMHLAARRGRLEAAAALIENGASMTVFSCHAHTALHSACLSGSVELIRFLLSNGADVNQQADAAASPTPLLTLCGDVDDHAAAVRLLLEHRARVNMEFDGWTPLTLCCRLGHQRSARLLLDAGAKLTTASDEGVPIVVASRNGHWQMIKLLIEYGADWSVLPKSRTLDETLAEVIRSGGWKAACNAHLPLHPATMDRCKSAAKTIQRHWNRFSFAPEGPGAERARRDFLRLSNSQPPESA